MDNKAGAMQDSDFYIDTHAETKKKGNVSFADEENKLVNKNRNVSFIENLITEACGGLETVDDSREEHNEAEEPGTCGASAWKRLSVDIACSDARALVSDTPFEFPDNERYRCTPRMLNGDDFGCSRETASSPTIAERQGIVTGVPNQLHQLVEARYWEQLTAQLTSEDSAVISKLTNEVDEAGRTPLMLACQQGPRFPPDIARLLIVANSKAASKPIAHGSGRFTTCLHVAADMGCSPATLNVLLSACPKAAETPDKSGNMPLHLLVNNGRYRYNTSYDFDDLSISATGSVSSTSSSLNSFATVHLLEEEESLHVIVCKMMINSYPQALHHRNDKGTTPLLLALYCRASSDLITLLLSRGDRDSVSLQDDFGSFPIHFCDRAPSVAVVRDILHFYPEGVHQKNNFGDTPLYFAMSDNCDVDVLRSLLESAKEPRKLVDSKNNREQNVLTFSWTSLFTEQLVAAEDDDKEQARLLKNKELVMTATSRTDLRESQLAHWWEKATLLLCASYHNTINFGHIEWNAVHAAAGTDCPPSMVEFVLKIHPEDVGSIDEDKNTPLHIGATRPDIVGIETMQALVNAHPSSALMRNNDGCTPLAIACLQSAPMDILQILLNANPEAACIQNEDGQTPLFISILVGSSIDVMRMLLEARPDAVHIRDKNGMSPIALAWQMLVAGKEAYADVLTKSRAMVEPKVKLNEELRRGKSNRLVLAIAKSSSSLNDDVRPWVAKIDLLLRALNHGSVKEPLPDGKQWRAVHAACTGGPCPPEVLAFALQILQSQAQVQNESGLLPLHIVSSAPPYDHDCLPQLASDEPIRLVLEAFSDAAIRLDLDGRLPLHRALATNKTWESGVKKLVSAFPESAVIRDPSTGLFPFMTAACSTNKVPSLNDGGKDDEMILNEKRQNVFSLRSKSKTLSEKADLATVNTVYCLLRLYPDTVHARNSNAERLYLWRRTEELMEEKKELEIKLANAELELEGRMSDEELKDVDRKKKQDDIQRREELCRSRSDRLELTSSVAFSQISNLHTSVKRMVTKTHT